MMCCLFPFCWPPKIKFDSVAVNCLARVFSLLRAHAICDIFITNSVHWASATLGPTSRYQSRVSVCLWVASPVQNATVRGGRLSCWVITLIKCKWLYSPMGRGREGEAWPLLLPLVTSTVQLWGALSRGQLSHPWSPG